MAEEKDQSQQEPGNKEPAAPEGSQVFAVRLPSNGAMIADRLIHLHYTMRHIPEETRSEYLKYLVTRDAEQMRDSIKSRRSKVAG